MTFRIFFAILLTNKDVCTARVLRPCFFVLSHRKRNEKRMVNLEKLLESTEDINSQLARYGVKFGIYKTEPSKNSCFPITPSPG